MKPFGVIVNILGISVLILSGQLLVVSEANLIDGLNDRLEQFNTCTIRITADFNKTNFQPFNVPVVLLRIEDRNSRDNRGSWWE